MQVCLSGDFVGWDANGNPIIASPDGNGGHVIPDGNGGFTPLIPVDGGPSEPQENRRGAKEP